MGAEKASAWKEQEHTGEKKEVLGKVEHKLEGQAAAKELPGLIADIAKFRYPQDPDAQQRQAKKQSFDTALTQVIGICRNDSQLSKYEIEKKDILDWCKIPMLENSQSEPWESMAHYPSFTVQQNPNNPPNQVAENILALRTGTSKIGLSPELMQTCTMSVMKRDPNSFGDSLLALPKPKEGKETYVVFLEFNMKGSKVKLFYDSSNPSDVRIDGLVAISGSAPFVVSGTAHIGPDSTITKYNGRKHPLLSEGAKINDFLLLLRLATEDKKRA